MGDRRRDEEREDLQPKTTDGSEKPGVADPGANRRGFLVELGTMSFLTAAIAKLGVSPGADGGSTLDGNLPYKRQYVGIDGNCGKPAPSKVEHVIEDNDCGNAKSNGDQDCGKTAPGENGNTWSDKDCVMSGGDGADNDCGKSSGAAPTWTDNDCSRSGGVDQDCGKSASGGSTWSDKDCDLSRRNDADNDCGKSSGRGETWLDSDCNTGGEDQDCGKPFMGGTHADSDGS